MTIEAKNDNAEAGFTLVVVLWFLVFLAAFVAPFAMAAYTSALIASYQSEKQRLDLIADGLTTVVAERLSANPQLAETLALNGEEIDCSTDQASVTFSVQDQLGLVDLNAADATAIEVGLLAIGLTQDVAAETAAAIQTYRSYATSSADGSASQIVVQNGLKRAPFETVVELTDFEPLSQADAALLHQVFTVNSGSGFLGRPAVPDRLTKYVAMLPVGGAGATTRRLGVTARIRLRTTGISGYAGYLVELTGGGGRLAFRRLEPLPFNPAEVAHDRPGGFCPAWLAVNTGRVVAGLGL